MKAILIVALVCCASVVQSVTLSKVPATAEKKWDIQYPKLGDIWTNCTASSDGAQIVSVAIEPKIPKGNQNVQINATINFKEEVTGGSVEIKIHTRVHSIDKTVDLCDLAKDAGLSCPIAAGITTFSVTQGVPSVSILKVHVTGSVKGTDQNKKELACINIDFELEN